MTECKSKSLQFTAAQRRQVVADFDGGRLTTDAGVLLLREVDQQIGLIDAINDCIPDPRDPRFTTHEQREMLAQRIYRLLLRAYPAEFRREVGSDMEDTFRDRYRAVLSKAKSLASIRLWRS